MSEKDISIIILTYQHVDFIETCLENVLNQQTTYSYEILIGEDESTDGTREKCIQYAEKYPTKIKLFLRSRKDVIYVNGAPTGKYNFIECLKSAKGKYIAYCEGDDYWIDPFKLQKQMTFLERHSDYTLCATRFQKLNEETSKIHNENDTFFHKTNRYELTIENFLNPYLLSTNTILFKNIINFDKIPLKGFKDVFLFALLLEKGKGIILNEFTSIYRIHKGGVWSLIEKKKKLQNNCLTAFEMHKYFKVPSITKFAYFSLKEYINLLSKSRENKKTLGILLIKYLKVSKDFLTKKQRSQLRYRYFLFCLNKSEFYV